MAVDDRLALSGLIPEIVSDEIIQSMPEYSTALRVHPNRRVRTKKTSVPVASVLPEAEWVEELSEANKATTDHVKPTTIMTFGSQFIEVEPLAAIVVVPEEVIEDLRDGAGTNVWDEIRPEIVAALGVKIDEAVYFGVPGTTSPASFEPGIEVQARAAGNVFSEATASDLYDAWNQTMALVEADGFTPNLALAGLQMRARFRGDRSNLQPNFGIDLGFDPASVVYPKNGSWLNAAATGGPGASAIVGQADRCVVAVRTDIEYKVLTEASLDVGGATINLAQSDAIALRVRMRCGFKVFNPVSRLAGTTGFPFAVLEP